MDTYVITKAYPLDTQEITIKSINLLYAEMTPVGSGCQSSNLVNNNEIHGKCRQIADLIREIEILNVK
jgi:hypothetical protein